MRRVLLGTALVVASGCALDSTDTGATRDDEPFGSAEWAGSYKTVECGASTAEWRPVLLQWVGGDDVTLTAGAGLQLTNTTGAPLTVIVKSQLDAPNQRIGLADQVVTLPATGATVVYINPAPVASQAAQEVTPLTAVVEVEVAGDRLFAENRYLHHLKGSRFQWYSEQFLEQYSRTAVLATAAQYGVSPTSMESDVLGTTQVVSGGHDQPDPQPGQAGSIPGLDQVMGGGSSGSPPAQAVCFWLNADYKSGGVDFADDDNGSTTVLHPAFGAKIWISVPFVGTFFGQVPRSGSPCVQFPEIASGFPYWMGMYFESHLGHSPDRDIRVRSYGEQGSTWAWVPGIDPYDVPRNAYFLISGGAGSVTHLSTHAGNRVLANELAVGIKMVSHYDDILGGAGPFSHQIDIRAENCPEWGPNVSCGGGTQVRVAPFDDGSYKAELIGHEVGHIVADMYLAGSIATSITYNAPPDPACDDFGEAHALYSKEWAGDALNEGLAHALGAHGLSSGSTLWKYYKNIPESGGIYTNQVIDLEDAGQFDRLHNFCTGDNTGFGTEADWLRFLWDYPLFFAGWPTLFGRLDAATVGMTTTNPYPRLYDETPAGIEQMLTAQRAALFGVDNTP